MPYYSVGIVSIQSDIVPEKATVALMLHVTKTDIKQKIALFNLAE
jgi:hypothetical protein